MRTFMQLFGLLMTVIFLLQVALAVDFKGPKIARTHGGSGYPSSGSNSGMGSQSGAGGTGEASSGMSFGAGASGGAGGSSKGSSGAESYGKGRK